MCSLYKGSRYSRDKEKRTPAQTRVFHAPAAVAGNSAQLSRSLIKMGFSSKCLTYERNQYSSSDDLVVWRGSEGLLSREIKRLQAVFHHVFTHDVYVFNYGSTLSFPSTNYETSSPISWTLAKLHMFWTDFLQYIELSILLIRQVKVVVVFQGDDVRQGDVQLEKYEESIAHHMEPGYYSKGSDKRKRQLVRRLQKFGAQLVALNPDLLQLLGKDAKFSPYGHIDLDKWQFSDLPKSDGTFVVGHFPSSKKIKGTSEIVAAIETMKRNGIMIDLRLISGVTQHQVKQEIEKCQIIVDQLFAGFYGGVAVESMALGRPVVAYLRDLDFEDLDQEFKSQIPVLSATSKTLVDGLTRVANLSASEMTEWALASREFVTKWHDPERVALNILDLARPLRIARP